MSRCSKAEDDESSEDSLSQQLAALMDEMDTQEDADAWLFGTETGPSSVADGLTSQRQQLEASASEDANVSSEAAKQKKREQVLVTTQEVCSDEANSNAHKALRVAAIAEVDLGHGEKDYWLSHRPKSKTAARQWRDYRNYVGKLLRLLGADAPDKPIKAVSILTTEFLDKFYEDLKTKCSSKGSRYCQSTITKTTWSLTSICKVMLPEDSSSKMVRHVRGLSKKTKLALSKGSDQKTIVEKKTKLALSQRSDKRNIVKKVQKRSKADTLNRMLTNRQQFLADTSKLKAKVKQLSDEGRHSEAKKAMFRLAERKASLLANLFILETGETARSAYRLKLGENIKYVDDESYKMVFKPGGLTMSEALGSSGLSNLSCRSDLKTLSERFGKQLWLYQEKFLRHLAEKCQRQVQDSLLFDAFSEKKFNRRVLLPVMKATTKRLRQVWKAALKSEAVRVGLTTGYIDWHFKEQKSVKRSGYTLQEKLQLQELVENVLKQGSS